MKDTLPVRVRLGVFELDVRAGELRHDDERIVLLQEQPFQVLLMLVEREGDIVTRDEIRNQLWPNDTVVEFDHSINTAIKKLRQALDDSADEPRYIETIPRRGYRLVIAVEWVSSGADAINSTPLRNPIRRQTQNKPPAREAWMGHPQPTQPQRTTHPQPTDQPQRRERPPEPGALIGRKVSHYRVLEVIGGGGMGVVYRAEDLKLGRRVALKFLPEDLAWDPVALQRFEREARTASSFNHPNICTVYEVEEHDGQPFLVMEYMEGETLRDWLTAVGAGQGLPLDQLLDIALQICAGLQAAHAKGIIHRDIKPANIFVTSAGQVKILDFGLAKLVDAAKQWGSDGPQAGQQATGDKTLRSRELQQDDAAITRLGSAVGTAGYMSPEQVRGEKLDARSDVFSFGLVLYEMASGQRAFSGDTGEMIRDAIMSSAPVPLRELNSKLPARLLSTITKALEKDRERRYQNAGEMRAELERLPRGGNPAKHQSRRYGRILLFGLALLLTAFLAFGFGRLWWSKTHPIAPRKVLSERQVTHNPAENRLIGAAISPDGKYLAYTDPVGLHLSVIETGEIHDVPLPDVLRTHLWAVTWFPDGEKLLFTAGSDTDGSAIWATSILGGVPRKLRGNGGLWTAVSPGGSLIAFVSSDGHELQVMGANGENPHKLLSSENDTYQGPAWSPTGQRLAYIRRTGTQTGGSIETVSLEGGPSSVVFSDPVLGNSGGPNLLWAADGRVIFASEEALGRNSSNLWSIAADPRSGKPSGPATKITNWDGVRAYSASISSAARLLAVVKAHSRNDVYVGELQDGGRRLVSPKRLTVSESDDYATGWLGDSKTVLFQTNRTGRNQVFAQTENGTAAPIHRSAEEQDGAETNPDGRWILYWSVARLGDTPATIKRLMRLPALGGFAEPVPESPADNSTDFDCPVRPDSSCVLGNWKQGELIFHSLDPAQGQGHEVARTKLALPTDLNWRVSPDGRRIALASTDQLHEKVRILDLANGAQRDLQLPQGWLIWSLSWTADGNALIAAAQSAPGYFIARIELNGKTSVLLDRGRNHWLGRAYPSADGRHLAFTQMTWENNVWLLENF